MRHPKEESRNEGHVQAGDGENGFLKIGLWSTFKNLTQLHSQSGDLRKVRSDKSSSLFRIAHLSQLIPNGAILPHSKAPAEAFFKSIDIF